MDSGQMRDGCFTFNGILNSVSSAIQKLFVFNGSKCLFIGCFDWMCGGGNCLPRDDPRDGAWFDCDQFQTEHPFCYDNAGMTDSPLTTARPRQRSMSNGKSTCTSPSSFKLVEHRKKSTDNLHFERNSAHINEKYFENLECGENIRLNGITISSRIQDKSKAKNFDTMKLDSRTDLITKNPSIHSPILGKRKSHFEDYQIPMRKRRSTSQTLNLRSPILGKRKLIFEDYPVPINNQSQHVIDNTHIENYQGLHSSIIRKKFLIEDCQIPLGLRSPILGRQKTNFQNCQTPLSLHYQSFGERVFPEDCSIDCNRSVNELKDGKDDGYSKNHWDISPQARCESIISDTFEQPVLPKRTKKYKKFSERNEELYKKEDVGYCLINNNIYHEKKLPYMYEVVGVLNKESSQDCNLSFDESKLPNLEPKIKFLMQENPQNGDLALSNPPKQRSLNLTAKDLENIIENILMNESFEINCDILYKYRKKSFNIKLVYDLVKESQRDYILSYPLSFSNNNYSIYIIKSLTLYSINFDQLCRPYCLALSEDAEKIKQKVIKSEDINYIKVPNEILIENVTWREIKTEGKLWQNIDKELNEMKMSLSKDIFQEFLTNEIRFISNMFSTSL